MSCAIGLLARVCVNTSGFVVRYFDHTNLYNEAYMPTLHSTRHLNAISPIRNLMNKIEYLLTKLQIRRNVAESLSETRKST
jgi:hypothetical protein